MEYVTGILLYNSFVKLPGSNLQNLGKNKAFFNSPRQAKHREKNMQHNAYLANLRKFREKSKQKSPYVKSRYVRNILAILLQNSLISEMCSLLQI